MTTTRTTRLLALAGAAVAGAALLAGCSSDETTSTATPTPTTASDRLQAIWDGNVLSSDKEAICASTGAEQLSAFQAQATPWLEGVPADLMPSDADMQAFLGEVCPG
jgi:outer membrane murein-binding lipoprotein Lpp